MGHWVGSSHNHADEYMGSALPFASGSIAVTDGVAKFVEFQHVTRWVQIFNNGAANGLRAGFTENGTGEKAPTSENYFVIPPNTASARLELKCTGLWLAGDGGNTTASLITGYTNIPAVKFLNLTGSAGFNGVG